MRSNGGPGRDVLHQQEALDRAARVHHVRYDLDLELSEGNGSYRGRAIVEFHLRSSAQPLFLDFTGTLRSLRSNGTDLVPDHRAHRIWLQPADLRMHNRLVIEYENTYDVTGDGLHSFVDPEDGASYIYSNLEPFSAHRIFPCFDQPDIKATYRLLVTAPAHWQVISAEASAQTTDMPHGRRMFDFPTTASFSTYLFSLIAGPYVRLDALHDRIPLGLYGRASMREELERSAEEVFEITGQGMDYYADLFGRRYPFHKYDQLFVPEFNAGAMENVGAVTFHDSYLFRDPPTYSQRLIRGEVILHELAHMWFGDLVTMRWWNDLWLNEAFATYLSYRCLADATRFEDAWRVFNGQMRPAAYRQDQLATTHPVATRVDHTDQAVGNFDAITYEKGAAVIKQLVASLGDAAFRRGLHAYIERHAWGNADLIRLPWRPRRSGWPATRRLGATVAADPIAQHHQDALVRLRWAHRYIGTTPVRAAGARRSCVPMRPPSAYCQQDTRGAGMRLDTIPVRIDQGCIARARGDRAARHRSSYSPTTATMTMRSSSWTRCHSPSRSSGFQNCPMRSCASRSGRHCGRWCVPARYARPTTWTRCGGSPLTRPTAHCCSRSSIAPSSPSAASCRKTIESLRHQGSRPWPSLPCGAVRMPTSGSCGREPRRRSPPMPAMSTSCWVSSMGAGRSKASSPISSYAGRSPSRPSPTRWMGQRSASPQNALAIPPTEGSGPPSRRV